MIIVFHKDNVVTDIVNKTEELFSDYRQKKVMSVLFTIASKHPNSILVWCHESLKDYLNIEGIKASFNLKNLMLSYSKGQYLPAQIGYVEDSPFLKVNKIVKYPTWLMSSDVGAIYATELTKFEKLIDSKNSFDFVLNSIAKIGMPKGLFCYSEPTLLKKGSLLTYNNKSSISELFKFVKYHYKWIWSVLLFINIIINESKFPIIAFLKSLFIKQKTQNLKFDLNPINPVLVDFTKTIDVIIPTLGRKEYLFNVLQDLEKQTLLPEQVIIVEQNQDKSSKSELEFISNRTWPFKIIHKFTYQTGACNARNIALNLTTSDYIYLADDDNEFDVNLLQDVIYEMQYYGHSTIAMSYLQKNEIEKHKNNIQWSTFGGGSSVISSKFLANLAFNMVYEFGYGEDTDFGMQLRNLGADIIYTPNIKVLHLKAPVGGFRTKFIHPWEKESNIMPKPSPTVMFYRRNHTTKQQLLGYKTILFLKYYKQQSIKVPFKYYSIFKKQWESSERWANRLSKIL